MRMYIFLSFIFAAFMGFNQLILSISSRQLSDSGFSLISIIENRLLFIGIFLYILGFCFWIFIISKLDIKIAYPIASTSILFSALFSSLYESRQLPFKYWIGILVILLGIYIITSYDS